MLCRGPGGRCTAGFSAGGFIADSGCCLRVALLVGGVLIVNDWPRFIGGVYRPVLTPCGGEHVVLELSTELVAV